MPKRKPVASNIPVSPSSVASMEVPDSFTSPESSTIEQASYDPERRTLLVTFRHERMQYLYGEVPEAVWIEFYRAQSRGKFFQQRIRPVFGGVRV